jgi:hypothetical protein
LKKLWLLVLATTFSITTFASGDSSSSVDKQLGRMDPLDFCEAYRGTPLGSILGATGLDTIDANGTLIFNPQLIEFTLTGNGVNDLANELGLLQFILENEDFDNGVLDHDTVNNAWNDNYRKLTNKYIGNDITHLQTIGLQIAAPGLIELFVGYLTLGDGDYNPNAGIGGEGTGSFGFAAGVMEQFSLIIDIVRELFPEQIPADFGLRNAALLKEDFVGIPALTALGDADGDGLTNAEEFQIFDPALCDVPANGVTYLSAALNSDADNDGMSDSFEVFYGLNPALDDAQEDLDGDLLTNLEEFLHPSDPTDIDDPEVTRFVAATGCADCPYPNGGTENNPWSLVYGLSQLDPDPGEERSQLLLDPGTYDGEIVMTPNSTLSGPPFDVYNLDQVNYDNHVVITGTILGAEGAAVENIILQAPPSSLASTVLLTMNNVDVNVRHTAFVGTATEVVTGILTLGTAPGNATIEACVFTGLANGIEIDSAVPTMRLCLFEESGVGVIYRDTALKSFSKSLGTNEDPNSGFNTFRSSLGDTPDNIAVINEGNATVDLQKNDWDIPNAQLNLAAVRDRIDGNANVDFFLPQGQALLAAALFCTVWDSETQIPILDASVDLQITPFDPITDNVDGVYAYPALSSGQYTLTVTPATDDYAERSITVDLEDSETKSVIVALSAPPADQGKSGGCYAPERGTGSSDLGAVILTTILTLLFLLFSGLRRHKKG